LDSIDFVSDDRMARSQFDDKRSDFNMDQSEDKSTNL